MPDPQNRNPRSASGNEAPDSGAAGDARVQRTFLHRILLYVPSLLRDERVSIGVLLYDPNTGERRLRLIKEESEFNRLRHLRPRADEEILRYLRDHLESRLSAVAVPNGNGGTVYYFDNPDSLTAPTVHQVAFYGLSNYLANESVATLAGLREALRAGRAGAVDA